MIPDIEIRIKPSVLEGVLFLLDLPKGTVYDGNKSPEIKSALSVLYPLSRKLHNKLHQWQRRDNASKRYRLKIAYYEAYTLYNYIHYGIGRMPYGFERNACAIVHDELNQQLQ